MGRTKEKPIWREQPGGKDGGSEQGPELAPGERRNDEGARGRPFKGSLKIRKGEHKGENHHHSESTLLSNPYSKELPWPFDS